MSSVATIKSALEELLKARRLSADAPPLRGEDRRGRPLPTGVATIDAMLFGGFPRGQLSEVHGPASSGAAAGVDLARLLWLRGQGIPGQKGLAEAVAAVGTLAGSGLFETVVLDLAGVAEAERRLPGATWIRLQRTVEDAPTALVLLADRHVACGPGGVSLALAPAGPRWSGASGPGRLLSGLGAQATAGRHVLRRADLLLRTFA